MNIAYRWFLGYGIDAPIPHFATVSYAFATRGVVSFAYRFAAPCGAQRAAKSHRFGTPPFPPKSAAFWRVSPVVKRANKNKKRKELARIAAKAYEKELRAEIDADRATHGKKPLPQKNEKKTREITASTTDPDCGLFHKGEHELPFAYGAHAAASPRPSLYSLLR